MDRIVIIEIGREGKLTAVYASPEIRVTVIDHAAETTYHVGVRDVENAPFDAAGMYFCTDPADHAEHTE